MTKKQFSKSSGLGMAKVVGLTVIGITAIIGLFFGNQGITTFWVGVSLTTVILMLIAFTDV